MGLTSAVTYGHHERRSVWACLGVALLTLAFSFILLLALAIEGILCLFMAAPIALPLAAVGGWVGYLIQNRTLRHNPSLAVLAATFLLMGFEKKALPEAPLFAVRSEVIVHAPPEKVWTNVVTFSELPSPRLALRSRYRLPDLRHHRRNGRGSHPVLQFYDRTLR